MANMTNDMTGTSPRITTGTSGQETFSALDAAPTAGMPTLIHAGANRAEAGFQDPVLGWIGVRADGTGNSVHAALVPGSADAVEALGGHLAGLNAYLADQHTPVEPVTLAASESRPGAFGMDQGTGQNMHQGAGQSMGQETDQGVPSDPGANGRRAAPDLDAGGRALPDQMDSVRFDAIPVGSRISVMA
jgi:hypothetical protein